jgi:hypothetical protein
MGDFVEVFESHNRKGGGVEAVRAGIVGGRGKYVFRTGEAGRKHRVENRQQYDVHGSTFRSINAVLQGSSNPNSASLTATHLTSHAAR